MDYPISVMQGEPCFDSLGVIKLRFEPSVPVNDRIFAQAQAGRTPELFFTRIWSFETAPAPEAAVKAVFSRAGHTVELAASAAGEASLLLDGAPREGVLTAYQISGEDLQGEYWGAVLMVPYRWLAASLDFDPDAPAVFEGNLLRERPALSSAVPHGETLRFVLR